MDISYRLNNSEIEKLKKYKNPSILLKKNNQFGRFCILFVKLNIKNENDYNEFLLKFEKNNFLKNAI